VGAPRLHTAIRAEQPKAGSHEASVRVASRSARQRQSGKTQCAADVDLTPISRLGRVVERGEQVSASAVLECLECLRQLHFGVPRDSALMQAVPQVLRVARCWLTEANEDRQSLENEFATLRVEVERTRMCVEDKREAIRISDEQAFERMEAQQAASLELRAASARLRQEVAMPAPPAAEAAAVDARASREQERSALEAEIAYLKGELQVLERRMDVSVAMRQAEDSIAVGKAKVQLEGSSLAKRDKLKAKVISKEFRIQELTDTLAEQEAKLEARRKRAERRAKKAASRDPHSSRRSEPLGRASPRRTPQVKEPGDDTLPRAR